MTATAEVGIADEMIPQQPYRLYVRWARKPGLHALPSQDTSDLTASMAAAARASRLGGVQYVAGYDDGDPRPVFVYRAGWELTDAGYQAEFAAT